MIKLNANSNQELLNEINNELNLTSTESTNQTTQTEQVKVDINMKRFGYSFKYMGLGMLGIFLIIGIVIVTVSVLNKVKKK